MTRNDALARRAALPTAFLLMAAALAGCVGDAPPELHDALEPGADDGTGTLSEASEVGPPTWRVGDWFGHHVFFGVDDSDGEHFNTIVVEDGASTYLLASDDADVAKIHAIFDIPILGDVRKGDLATTGLGMEFQLYQFPLKHNKTWTATQRFDEFFFQEMAGEDFRVTFHVTFAPAIPTPEGDLPGFQIHGLLDDGTLLWEYDYVPAIGWYAHFYLYDPLTEGEDDFLWHAMSMGHGDNWTGTYYVDTAEQAAEVVNTVIPPAAAEGGIAPQPHASFDVAADDSYVFGFIFNFALTGVHEVRLIEPDGQMRTYRAQHLAPPDGGMFTFAEVDLAAKEGTWEVVLVGAGVAVVGGVFLWTIIETQGVL